MENIQGKVIEIVNRLTTAGKITGTDEKLIELGIDSLKKVELMIALEDEFKLQFNDSELNPERFINIMDLIELVKKYCGE